MKKLFLPLCIAVTSICFGVTCDSISRSEILFSPEDAIVDTLISHIDKESKSVKVAVYNLTHRSIIKALIDAHKKGIQVEVIIDVQTTKSRAGIKKMIAANLPVFVWKPVPIYALASEKRPRIPLMHDKFCILGDNRVWTGSFNFTFQASCCNRENIVVLESAQAAGYYCEEFEKLKQGSIPLAEYLSSTDK